MKDLPPVARYYVGSTIAASALVLAWWGPGALVPTNLKLFVVLLTCSTLAAAFKVTLPLTTSQSTMSVSYAVDFASLLLLGADATMLVAATGAWSQCTIRTKDSSPVYRTLFSISSLLLTVKASGLVFDALGGQPVGTASSWAALPKPLVGAAFVYFVSNTTLVAIAIGLSTSKPITRVWYDNFLWSFPSYFGGAGAAAIGAVVLASGRYAVAALVFAPLYLMYKAYKIYLGRIQDQQTHVRQVSDLHLATIEALALAIDAKDQTAQSHIRRVQVYAAGVARSLGMSENDIQGVKTAALLHDIGKLAVPEHILSKPGPLTQEEFQKIRIHPQVGAEIISGVPFPYPVAPLIASHHGRWDSKGYPTGLKGEDIPLGARILSVVDYFDALVSERPYHRAMTVTQALGLLQQESGRALDPQVVSTFVTQYAALAAEAEHTPFPARTLTRVATEESEAQPSAGLVTESTAPRTTVFQDIALAHREIYALYEIAQALGSSLGVSDTMALISSKLNHIIPLSACALFLRNGDTDSLQCRFSTGVESSTIERFAMNFGEGLNGWVARTRRPLVNAPPAAEFEAVGAPEPTTLHAALICPLVFSEQLIGTLAVYHTTAGIYTDDHRRLLDRISEQAAAVIHNSMVFEQTQEDSLADPLTELPNTRQLFMHLSRELSRATRLKSEVALLVMDLDNFKDVNDRYGHQVGDRALLELANALKTAIRPYDICVRYAGDEFVVVLSGCGADEADRKRIELQRAVESVQFDAAPGSRLPLGISIGAALFPHDGESYEKLLATADARMYRNKANRKAHLHEDSAPLVPDLAHVAGHEPQDGPLPEAVTGSQQPAVTLL